MNNNPVNIYNIYKYLVNLFKIEVIPAFKVEIRNKLTEIIFTFNYNNKQSTIIYNTETKLWRSYTNVVSLNDIQSNNNYDYSYLIKNKMIAFDNDMFIFQSYDINDILEPSLTPFSPVIFNDNYLDPRYLYDVDNIKLHNLNHKHYYMFINNLYHNDKKMIFEKYSGSIDNVPEELWIHIYSYYKYSDMHYNDFYNQFL